MGDVSKYTGPDRKSEGQAAKQASNATAARLSGESPPASRTSCPIQRDKPRRSSERHRGMTTYQLTDRLHGRTVRVQADHIVSTVASWLAELEAWSPLVELLGRAVRDGDWPAIHAIADYLSVEVQVAA
jgi:hypothetical protein